MPANLQLKAFQAYVFLLLLIFWSAAAVAAQVTFAHDLRDIPPAAVGISVLLAVIGGSAWTASKLAAPDVVVKSVPLEVLKDLLASVVIGLVTFFAGTYFEWPSVVQAGLITLGGYGGSRVLEPLLAIGVKRLARFFGVDEATLTPPPALPPATPPADPAANGESQ
jgi:hypothetical protein